MSDLKGNMNLNEVIRFLVAKAEKDTGDEYFNIIHAIALIFPANLIEQLAQLVNGPVYDGDIISKVNRGELFDMGLAIRVCCKGQQGYTGAKYTAYSLVKRLAEK